MTATPSMIALSKLVPGEEVNPRKGEPESIDELAASIRAKGVIQTLVARPLNGGDTYEVYVGNRRLLAIKQVVDQDGLEDFDVPVMIREADDLEASEVALAENVERLPLNVVDEVEAFAKLEHDGRKVAEIAATFGIGERRVRQRLALGNLPSGILTALREDEIGLDTAQAFTLTSDTARQEHVFNALAKDGNVSTWRVREQLSKDTAKASGGLAEFVGDEAYIEAGGSIKDDLFEDERYYSDAGLLVTMVRDKVQAQIDALKADGWSWVRYADDLPESWRWNWQKFNGKGEMPDGNQDRIDEIEKELEALEDAPRTNATWDQERLLSLELDELQRREYTANQKAKLGVVFCVSNQGVETWFGVQHPDDAKGAKKAEPDAKKDGPKPLPATLLHDLSRHATGACQLALSRNGKNAETLLLATLVHEAARSHKPGCHAIKITGMHYFEHPNAFDAHTEFVEYRDSVLKGVPTKTFAGTVHHIADMTPKQRQALMAVLVASCLNITNQGEDHVKATTDLINPKIETSFKADAEFFARLNSAQIKAAISEACGKQLADAHAKDKKGDLVTLAAREVGKTAWLPEPLRNAHYTGPAAKKPRAKKSDKAEATA